MQCILYYAINFIAPYRFDLQRYFNLVRDIRLALGLLWIPLMHFNVYYTML